jgi:hypothetical protein
MIIYHLSLAIEQLFLFHIRAISGLLHQPESEYRL